MGQTSILLCSDSLGPNAFTRAYINFQNAEDVFTFRDKFDGYVFVDAKGMYTTGNPHPLPHTHFCL